MQDLQEKLRKMNDALESLVLEIAARARELRRYPHFEKSDRLDRAMIYTQNAGFKITKARQELQ